MRGIREGFVANLPVAASVAAYGSVLGVLAARKGIGWLTLMAMNLTIFAGSAQFVMVEMWLAPLPILEMTAAVLIINLRYLLIGASLNPVFAGAPISRKFTFMHLVADENWAVTMAARKNGDATIGFLFGGGLCCMLAWCFGTLFGHRLGALVTNPEALALDFAFSAVFTALAVSLWRGREDAWPWLAAIAISVIGERLVPGKWYILMGGVGGALVAALQSPGKKGEAHDNAV